MSYHLLWELVQVALEHPGLVGSAAAAGGDSTGFLYPFLDAAEDDEASLRDALRASAESLAADYAVVTALANDLGAERIFSRQLDAFSQPGDVLVGCSTSGASRNLLVAFDQAAGLGLTTVGLSGYGGGSFEGHASVHHSLVVQRSGSETARSCSSRGVRDDRAIHRGHSLSGP